VAAAQFEPSPLGARLRSAREHAGLTVIQAAERLHVDPRLIEALEGDRFEELGASVYVRGHIRHYAELVGESPGELQELYSASAHAAHKIDLTRVPKGQDSAGASSALLVPAVLVVAFVAVIGMVWWVAGTLNGSRLPHRGGAAAQQSEGFVASVEGRAATVAPSVTGPGGVGPSAAAAARQSVATPVAGLPPGERPPVGGTLPESTHSRAAVPARATALRMHFAEDSWAEVYDAQGERLFYDIGSADSTRTVSGMPPLKIVLGNPVGVSLELDGRPVSVPDGAQRNVTVEFRITRSGHSAPAHLAAAGEHASTASVQAP
jgi:cytoskeleton protein RodZ